MHAMSHSHSSVSPGSARRRVFCPAEDLPFVLHRERARADRIHSGFSVVLFGLRGGQEDAASVAKMGAVVASRARETDEICLVGGRFVCAVLPDTPPAGGRRFAEAVRASLNGQADKATFQILSYPSATPGEAGPDAGAD